MIRRLSIAPGLLGAACTAAPNRLEQVSRENEAVAAAFGEKREAQAPVMPPAPPLTRHGVTLGPPPAGIDEALWRDIGWFPADTIDISGLVDHHAQSLPRWLESTVGERFPACAPLFAGVERTYMMQSAESSKATSVFYGSMTRVDERACMQAALGEFGVTGEQRGDLTMLSPAEGPGTRLAWFGRDGGNVVILEGDTPLERWILPVGTLAEQPALVRLVAAVDRTRGAWSVGLRDYGTALTGVESAGYTMTMKMPPPGGDRRIEMAGQLEFATPEAAKQAEAGAAALAREVPGAAELGIAVTLQAEGAWLTASIKADFEGVEEQAITEWLQLLLSKIHARVADPAPASPAAAPRERAVARPVMD